MKSSRNKHDHFGSCILFVKCKMLNQVPKRTDFPVVYLCCYQFIFPWLFMHLSMTEICYFCYHRFRSFYFRGLLTGAIFNLQSSGGLNEPLKIQQISIYKFPSLITKSKTLLLTARYHK